jgi:hypothetical protein
MSKVVRRDNEEYCIVLGNFIHHIPFRWLQGGFTEETTMLVLQEWQLGGVVLCFRCNRDIGPLVE